MNFIMNADKLNRHFTIEVDISGYTWYPSTPVLYDFGNGEKGQISYLRQMACTHAMRVVTNDGDDFQVENIQVLSTKLRYPH